MKIYSVNLKNIGPFREQSLSFRDTNGRIYPVVIFTGVNGTGKSVLIDAIRTAFKGVHGIERDVVKDKSDFLIELELEVEGHYAKVISDSLGFNGNPSGENPYSQFFTLSMDQNNKANWVIDYWSPDIPVEKFKIDSITSIEKEKALVGSLDKIHPNVDLTKFICSIDYISGSKKEEEASSAKFVYKLIKEVFDDCVEKGSFQYVERETLTPIVRTHGMNVSLEKLSSGNILLVKHLVGLISRMYGICRMNEMKISEMAKLEGILFIDEIENHLHPQYQKSILGIIRKHFPNLQIILTTHSPFVVSSVNDAKIYVCVDRSDHSEIIDATADYSAYAVDDVLGTKVFDIDPFSKEISDMLEKRKKAIKLGNVKAKDKIEKALIKLNESYFGYYDLKEQISFYEKNETH